ncbi:LexA family transcriptional repressor [Candidatus Falkowbacteria bacterium CG10_big_fil_rev_8_21_14_0_10_43_10]|uniref:LexA family transcriptional repressor n=1 Tax=Candidatus Falkowbacteria bacterium CG10_big_fil_rev_8_21_14_0_10_43_10 TaxID=1974567 RepID=A0A2H0V339_9BACT|nr:MAG: LexA family transcriptional repressor [Candidatus Falkowbacteria bacterium CG10_big_fil_rev_8_21_14_0_10_43_10]
MSKENYQNYKKHFINFYQRSRRLPSYAEMLSIFNFQSKNAVAKVVAKFVDEGLVGKDETGRLIAGPDMFGVRLLGTVQAGLPTTAEQEVGEALSLDEYLIEKKDKTYLLEVTGDSMIEAGINEGDLVIVEQGRAPKVGDIVIAEVDHEWTMKFLEKENGRMILKPANKNYPIIRPQGEMNIGGVVKGVARKY